MPSFETLLAVTLSGLALSATPGPSMLYILSHSVGQSKAAGLASALGLGIGGVILAGATALGLATVLTRINGAIEVLSIAGSIYIIYLAFNMIYEAYQTKTDDFVVSGVKQRNISHIVWRGILVELLNPKTVLFFTLFLPQFIVTDSADANGISITIQFLVLGIIVPLTAIPSDLIVAYIGGSLAETINKNNTIRIVLSWIGAVILAFVALNIQFKFI